MQALQHRRSDCKASKRRSMADDEDELLEFLDELAGADTSLAPKTCHQSSAISCLDVLGHDMTLQSQLRQAPSMSGVRGMQVHAQPLLTPKVVKTPEQILQQLFQRPSRPFSDDFSLQIMQPCTAVPLKAALEVKHEALPSVLMPISEAPMPPEEGSATPQLLPMGSLNREGQPYTVSLVTHHTSFRLMWSGSSKVCQIMSQL